MGVRIEIFRMMLYLSFPVSMFWISNQGEFYEEYVIRKKRELYPPDDGEQRKRMEDFKEKLRLKREERLLDRMAQDYDE